MNGNPSNVTGTALAVTLGGPAMAFGLFSDASCLTAIAAPGQPAAELPRVVR